MKYAIFFAGSGQKARDASLIYTQWEAGLKSLGYATLLLDGVGEFETTKNWLGFKTSQTSKATGKGWALIVRRAMEWLEDEVRVGNSLDKVVIVGMSRGGVQAVVCANCLKHKYGHAPVFVFAIDPVQGWHPGNQGSFDMRTERSGSRGTRDELKTDYSLQENAPNTLSDNVKRYLSVIMQFRGSQRLIPGFTPQSPSLQNMTVDCPHIVYELPGDHSTGVDSGLTTNGSVHKQSSSRNTRSLVTTDMFYHWLRKESFGDVGQVDDFVVVDAYCRIANEDLAGVQFDNKKSGFSFLMASHPGAGRSFEANPMSRFHKGRGHLVQSTQVFAAKDLNPIMLGYYVNERHFELYKAFEPRLQIEMRKPPNQRQHLSNIIAWINRNKKDFRQG